MVDCSRSARYLAFLSPPAEYVQGGTPDILSAARTVLSDWNHTKIPFFSIPPVIHPSSLPSLTAEGQIAPGAENVGQAQIVQQLAQAFSLPGFDFDGNDGMDVIEAADEGAFAPDAAEEEMFIEDTGLDDSKEMELDEAE